MAGKHLSVLSTMARGSDRLTQADVEVQEDLIRIGRAGGHPFGVDMAAELYQALALWAQEVQSQLDAGVIGMGKKTCVDQILHQEVGAGLEELAPIINTLYEEGGNHDGPGTPQNTSHPAAPVLRARNRPY